MQTDDQKPQASGVGSSASLGITENQFRAALKHLEDLLACCTTLEEYVKQTEDPESFHYLVSCAKAFKDRHRKHYLPHYQKDFEDAVL